MTRRVADPTSTERTRQFRMTSHASPMRLRVAVRAVLALGIAASIAANVLHAQDNPIARVISAWPPGALFITVEVVSRVPVRSRALSWSRVAAAAVIAGIAAWVSYWHMVAVATRYGEATDSAHLLPLSVDGLVVVASICLFELGARVRGTATAPAGDAWGRVARWGRGAVRLVTFSDAREWVGRRRAGGWIAPAADAPAGTPARVAPTPTPDDKEPLGPAAPVLAGRWLAPVAGTPDDDALVTQLRGDIEAGRLKADPGVGTIRKHLKVGQERATRLRDALATAESDDREAAHA